MGLIKEVCNEELSKIFLGNTLTTSQGENGARSLGDVHKDTLVLLSLFQPLPPSIM